MAGDVIDIEVRFTHKGLEQLERQLYLRPSSYQKIDEYSYMFHCTELQAIHYFFKFGRDDVIVSPQKLHDKLKYYYAQAWNAYQNDDAPTAPKDEKNPNQCEISDQ
jgi:hypothetical protein